MKTPLRRPTAHAGLTLLEIVVVVAILATLAGFLVPSLAQFSAQGKTTAAKASLAQIRDAIVGSGGQPGYFHDVGTAPISLADLLSTAIPSAPSGIQPFDRDSNLGWRGPYILGGVAIDTAKYNAFHASFKNTSTVDDYDDYVQDPDHVILDVWGNPIIIQRLKVSGGTLYATKRADGTDVTIGATAAADGDYSRIISAGPDGIISTPLFYLVGNAPYPLIADRGDDIVLFLFRGDVP